MTNKLTAQQEAFCKCVADGMNNSDAYRAVYKTTKSTAKSINEVASRLANDVKVLSRVKELKAKLESKQLWSREHSVKVLANIALQKDAQLSAKVSAVKELNMMHGYNEPTKVDHLSSDGSMKSPPTRIELVAPSDNKAH
jgi:phage terminase small subunit